jgi:hypothetical protein
MSFFQRIRRKSSASHPQLAPAQHATATAQPSSPKLARRQNSGQLDPGQSEVSPKNPSVRSPQHPSATKTDIEPAILLLESVPRCWSIVSNSNRSRPTLGAPSVYSSIRERCYRNLALFIIPHHPHVRSHDTVMPCPPSPLSAEMSTFLVVSPK